MEGVFESSYYWDFEKRFLEEGIMTIIYPTNTNRYLKYPK